MRKLSSSRGVRRGSVTALAILSLALLIGVIAIVVDGGGLMEERRHVQAAADAAALAAASDLLSNYSANKGVDSSGTAAASARSVAAANGFSNDGVTSLVTVNVSPQTYQAGPNAGQTIPAGYVEVIIQYNAGRMFSNIFGSGSVPVRARAVARGLWAPNNNGLMLLSVNAGPALYTYVDAQLGITGGLQINSGNSGAISLGHNGLTVGQVNLNVAAGISSSSLLSSLLGIGGSTPTVTTSAPVPDPLRYLPTPNPSLLPTGNTVRGGSITDLYPGVYKNTINASGTTYLHANSDGTPGVYFLESGFNIKNATVMTAPSETAGVMIYNDWQNQGDSINVSANGSLSLIPPASGPYQGVSIFQKRGTIGDQTVAPILVSANGSMNVTGTIYAAYASVSLSGTSSLSAGQIIADTLSAGGNASISINPGTQPLANTRTFGLVE